MRFIQRIIEAAGAALSRGQIRVWGDAPPAAPAGGCVHCQAGEPHLTLTPGMWMGLVDGSLPRIDGWKPCMTGYRMHREP